MKGLTAVLSIIWVLLWNTLRSITQPTQVAFTCSNSTMETSETVWNSSKLTVKSLNVFQTSYSVSVPDSEQVNIN